MTATLRLVTAMLGLGPLAYDLLLHIWTSVTLLKQNGHLLDRSG
jgi:hypothetical protein